MVAASFRFYSDIIRFAKTNRGCWCAPGRKPFDNATQERETRVNTELDYRGPRWIGGCGLVAFLFTTLHVPCLWADEVGRPNVVVILCDDLGYGDLECYGHPTIKTPHLNKLASDGIRFTDFYSAAPVCSPSRVGLLTGRSPNRAGIFDWIPPGRQARPDARDQVHMRRDEVTIAKLLQAAGYATCHAGKWHCNSRFNDPTQPQPDDAGFDHWLSTQNNAAPSHANPVNYVRNGRPVGRLDGYSCQLAVDEVAEWLKNHKQQNADRPFFVYLAFHEPHEPVASPPELVELYRRQSTSEDQAQYFANVHNVDLAVGRTVNVLEELGLASNTLVVFTSDNGPETLNRYRSAKRSFGSPGSLKGMKLHTHEAGFRVPGIIYWPAQVKPGQTISTAVSSLDFLPTFCQLAGVQLPADRHFDGIDISRLLVEGKRPQRDKPLVWCYFNAINEARVAMRSGDWKVMARLVDEASQPLARVSNLTTDRKQDFAKATLTDFEIYNLASDPNERRNLTEESSRSSQLRVQLIEAYNELLADSHSWTP